VLAGVLLIRARTWRGDGAAERAGLENGFKHLRTLEYRIIRQLPVDRVGQTRPILSLPCTPAAPRSRGISTLHHPKISVRVYAGNRLWRVRIFLEAFKRAGLAGSMCSRLTALRWCHTSYMSAGRTSPSVSIGLLKVARNEDKVQRLVRICLSLKPQE
jgi:hypothetical protein